MELITAYVGVGSNMGNPEDNCVEAARLLEEAVRSRLRLSSLYLTEPQEKKDQNWFVNAVAEMRCAVPCPDLFRALEMIEMEMGRERIARNGPRIIDLDLLLYGDIVSDSDQLTVPHPRFHQRRFVLVPLAELVPDLIHPVLKKSIKELLGELGENGQKVLRIK